MEKKYREIYTPGSGQIIEKKSRFIGDTFAVHSESEAQEYVQGIRKKHYDARHHCYAYILGDDNAVRFSDDGEPQGTAGKPILDVLVGEGLRNTLIVVTRYFGGTLLGTGGLTRAYRQAAKEALGASVLIERQKGFLFTVTISYDILGKLENLIRDDESIYEIDSEYGLNVKKSFVVESTQRQRIESSVTEISADKAITDISEELDYGIAENRVIWL